MKEDIPAAIKDGNVDAACLDDDKARPQGTTHPERRQGERRARNERRSSHGSGTYGPDRRIGERRKEGRRADDK